jgi:SH3-like domain-containing protein
MFRRSGACARGFRRLSATAAAPLGGGVRLVCAVVLLAAGAVDAAEYRSIVAPSVMYDAPSRQASRVFIAPRGMPVEIISSLGAWIKVRDASGDVVWVERTDLGERRSVVTTSLVTVRQQPQDTAVEVMQLERGVLLELVRTTPAAGSASTEWIEVRHREGGSGWVRIAEVWGW